MALNPPSWMEPAEAASDREVREETAARFDALADAEMAAARRWWTP